MYCIFCQRYNKYRKVCMTCRTGFVRWVNSYVTLPDGSSCSLSMAAHKFLEHASPSVEQCIDLELRVSDNPRAWPGFHLGQSKWVIPHQVINLPEPLNYYNSYEVIKQALHPYLSPK